MNQVLFFLLFPECDNESMNSIEKIDEIVKMLIKIKKFCRLYHLNSLFLYDSDALDYFENVADLLDRKDKMQNIRNVLDRNAINVKNQTRKESDVYYVRYDTKSLCTDIQTPLIIQNIPGNECDKCLVSFVENVPTDYGYVHVIRDAVHRYDLPKIETVRLFHSTSDIVEWLKTFDNGSLLISESLDYTRTSYRWNNQCIYRKNDNNTYWYFDYFHKDNKPHYEVFDSNGTWLGEADAINGNPVIPSNTNQNKSISHILHGKP